MKKCPFCAEEIQEEAVKCKHCGEFLDKAAKKSDVKWYFRTSFVVVAFLCVGPFALPLIWLHPSMSNTKKIIYTGIIIIVTYYLWIAMAKAVGSIQEYYSLIFN